MSSAKAGRQEKRQERRRVWKIGRMRVDIDGQAVAVWVV
jgi:hypothetical protein